MKKVLKKVVVNGEKISKYRIQEIVDDAIKNITLQGFTNVEDLANIVAVNGFNNDTIIDCILDKLHEEYSLAINYERCKEETEAVASNIIAIVEKELIVLNLIQLRCNLFIDKINEDAAMEDSKDAVFHAATEAAEKVVNDSKPSIESIMPTLTAPETTSEEVTGPDVIPTALDTAEKDSTTVSDPVKETKELTYINVDLD